MTANTIITPATLDDLPNMVDFQLKMASETEGLELDKTVLERGIESALNDSGKARYFIAKNNSQGDKYVSYWNDSVDRRR